MTSFIPDFLPPHKTDIKQLLTTLEDNTIYLVECAITKDNMIHQSLLWVGFANTGSYSMLFNNTYSKGQIYEDSKKYTDLFDVYYIKIIENLILEVHFKYKNG